LRTLPFVQTKRTTDIFFPSSIGPQTAPARLRPLLAVGLALLACACTFKPEGTERLALSSRDHGFVDELLAGDGGARHGFDHPLLNPFGAPPMSAPAPTNCRFEQQPGGGFLERHRGLATSAANLRQVLALCSADHGTAGGNDQAAANSFARTLDFLRAAGFIGAGS
jgi:hypothetical protein